MDGCQQSGCQLLGGETAEMPGFYVKGEYDLAGFAVGAVKRDRVIDGKSIKAGDAVLGLASSGVNSNGFSLVRKVLEVAGVSLHDPAPWGGSVSAGLALLEPTIIYVKRVLALHEQVRPVCCCMRLPPHTTSHPTALVSVSAAFWFSLLLLLTVPAQPVLHGDVHMPFAPMPTVCCCHTAVCLSICLSVCHHAAVCCQCALSCAPPGERQGPGAHHGRRHDRKYPPCDSQGTGGPDQGGPLGAATHVCLAAKGWRSLRRKNSAVS